MARSSDENTIALPAFVDSVWDMKINGEKLDVSGIPLEKQNAVQLMTIHKSKGLEFPYVFICGCGNRAKSDRNENAAYFSEEWGVALNIPTHKSIENIAGKVSNYFYEEAKAEAAAKAEAELRRLLYVAITRAEKEVYFSAQYTGEIKPNVTNFMGLLAPTILYYEENNIPPNYKPYDIEEI